MYEIIHPPLYADGDERHDGHVEADDEHVALDATHSGAQQPAAVHHELGDLGHSEEHDEQVSRRQVQDEQVRHRAPHLSVRHDDPDDEQVSHDADEADGAEEKRETDDRFRSRGPRW